MNALTEKIVMIEVGDHLVLQMPTPGQCSGCSSCHAFFICRGGRTLCVHCDARAQERLAASARVALAMTFSGPAFIPCRCPVDPRPESLFKCICEASWPENNPRDQ